MIPPPTGIPQPQFAPQRPPPPMYPGVPPQQAFYPNLAPRLAYPIIYQSAKPVATEPIILDHPSVTPMVEPTKFLDKLGHSITSASNNMQLCDLVDASDVVTFRCPRCQYEGQSRAMNTLGPCTYFGITALCCICPPCSIIPCLSKKCQYIQHYCPQCGQKIGVTYPG